MTFVDAKTDKKRRTIALSGSAVALSRRTEPPKTAKRFKAENMWQESDLVLTTELGKPAEPHNLLRAVRIASERRACRA